MREVGGDIGHSEVREWGEGRDMGCEMRVRSEEREVYRICR